MSKGSGSPVAGVTDRQFTSSDAPVERSKPGLAFVFLNASVATYVGLVFLVSAIPGLSRLVHVSLLVTILSLFVVMAGRTIRLPREPVIGLMWLFVGFAWLSVLWSGNDTAAFARAVALVVSVTGATVIWVALWAGASKKSVLMAATLGAIVQAGVALYQYYLYGGVRATGLTGNANALAIEVSLAALIGLAMVRDHRFWQAVVAVVLVAIVTVVSGSRKMIAVWGGLLMLAGARFGAKLRNSAMLLGAVLLLIPFISIGVTSTSGFWVNPLLEPIQEIQVYERFERLAEGRDRSGQTRLSMIVRGYELWQASPLWGYGIDQFRYVSGFAKYSHNNYVELLVSFGMVGFLLYYSVIGSIMARSVRRIFVGSQHAWPVLVICIVILFWDLALVSFTERLFWIVFAVLLYQLASEDRPA
jgi:O-antigen ligase